MKQNKDSCKLLGFLSCLKMLVNELKNCIGIHYLLNRLTYLSLITLQGLKINKTKAKYLHNLILPL